MNGLFIRLRRNRIRNSGRYCRIAICACLHVAMAAAAAFGADESDLSRPNESAGPTTVRITMFLADLHEVNGAEQTFNADVVVTAEWLDPRFAGRWTAIHGVPLGEIWNPRLALINQRSVVQLFPERVLVEPSGLVHWQKRWLGSFSTRLDLRDFPMDHQRFEVQVVSLGYPPDSVSLVVKPERSQSTRAKTLSQIGK